MFWLLCLGFVAEDPGLETNWRGGGLRSPPFVLYLFSHGRRAGQGSGMYWCRYAASYSDQPNGGQIVALTPGIGSANFNWQDAIKSTLNCKNNVSSHAVSYDSWGPHVARRIAFVRDVFKLGFSQRHFDEFWDWISDSVLMCQFHNNDKLAL